MIFALGDRKRLAGLCGPVESETSTQKEVGREVCAGIGGVKITTLKTTGYSARVEKRFICASCNAQFETLKELENHWNRIGIVRGKPKK